MASFENIIEKILCQIACNVLPKFQTHQEFREIDDDSHSFTIFGQNSRRTNLDVASPSFGVSIS